MLCISIRSIHEVCRRSKCTHVLAGLVLVVPGSRTEQFCLYRATWDKRHRLNVCPCHFSSFYTAGSLHMPITLAWVVQMSTKTSSLASLYTAFTCSVLPIFPAKIEMHIFGVLDAKFLHRPNLETLHLLKFLYRQELQ